MIRVGEARRQRGPRWGEGLEKRDWRAGAPAAALTSALALGVVLVATWLRLWQLQTVPPGLWFDESLNGMETLWMLREQSWPLFILQGQGREVLFYYLLRLSVSALGGTVYALRVVPALLGVLAVALMYRWSLALFGGERAGRWLALLGAASLAVSFWYLVMNRVSYRANTLLPLLLVTGYFFWRGWQTGKLGYYALAGLGLGLCQYTYLAGRLVPGVFIGFYGVQCMVSWWRPHLRALPDFREGGQGNLRRAGVGLLVMLGVAGVVFGPLWLFFMNHPELFWERSGDVALSLDEGGSDWVTFGGQFVAAVRVFIDGGDPNWRHHLLSRAVFDWFSTIGFWIGLGVAVRFFYRPVYSFLLVMLGVMWLPALLAEPAFHTLRLSGVLPAYYALMALGWLTVAEGAARFLGAWFGERARGLVVLSALLLFSGTRTGYDYFYRWAGHPEVYRAFEGPVAELADYLISAESGSSVIIPYYLYAHASMRYVLHDHFREAVLMPEAVAGRLRQQAGASLLISQYPDDDGLPPAFVWLVKEGTGAGVAYVSAVNRELALAGLKQQPTPVQDERGNVIAQQYRVEPQAILDLFPRRLPHKETAAVWADNLRLSHYEFAPATAQGGEMVRLALAWQLLGYTGLQEKLFLQLVDSRGQPVGQQEQAPISRKMYRWREEAIVLEQHALPLDPSLPAGLYFVRLGFFQPRTGARVPVMTPAGQSLGDEFIVGPLYVRDGPVDPAQPDQPLQVSLDGKFELLGYSMYPLEPEGATRVSLYWQVLAPPDKDYTVFVQWLDPQNNILAQVDAQPLYPLYPTSRWQPGEILSEQFTLPLSQAELAEDGSLITGMYDLDTGVRLPVYDAQGQPVADGVIKLID